MTVSFALCKQSQEAFVRVCLLSELGSFAMPSTCNIIKQEYLVINFQLCFSIFVSHAMVLPDQVCVSRGLSV